MYTKFWLVCILEKSFLTATVGYYRSNLRQLQVCKVIPQFMLYVIPTQMRFEETLTLTLQRVTWPPQRAAFQERPISLLLDHLLCPSCRCSLQRKQRIIVGTNSHLGHVYNLNVPTKIVILKKTAVMSYQIHILYVALEYVVPHDTERYYCSKLLFPTQTNLVFT